MSINYEAVGRYVTAEEAVTNLLYKQSQLVDQINHILSQTRQNYSATNTIRTVKTAKLIELSTELNQVQVELLDVIREANQYADDAKKPKINLIES